MNIEHVATVKDEILIEDLIYQSKLEDYRKYGHDVAAVAGDKIEAIKRELLKRLNK